MKNKKFTLIDALIVLAVIVGVFVISKVMTPAQVTPTGKTEFTVLATGVDNEIAKNLKSEDIAVLSHAQKTNVTITDVTYKPSEVNIFNNQTGKYNTVSSELESDVYVKVLADAKIDQNSIVAGDIFIRVGTNVNLSNKNLALQGYIVDILSEQ